MTLRSMAIVILNRMVFSFFGALVLDQQLRPAPPCASSAWIGVRPSMVFAVAFYGSYFF